MDQPRDNPGDRPLPILGRLRGGVRGDPAPRNEEVPVVRPNHYRPNDLEARVDRLESLDEIRQLPHRYALAVGARKIDDASHAHGVI